MTKDDEKILIGTAATVRELVIELRLAGFEDENTVAEVLKYFHINRQTVAIDRVADALEELVTLKKVEMNI